MDSGAGDGPQPSRWSKTGAAIMWTTTVLAGIGGIIAGLAELGVFEKKDKETPAASAPAATPAAAIDRRPIVVRIDMPDGSSLRGFVTPRGQIISVATSAGATATWTEGNAKVSAKLELVAERSGLAAFRPAGRTAPSVDYPIRGAASLRAGDPAAVYLGPSQSTSARVIDVHPDTDHLLSITRASALGDLCAPILDGENQLVAIVTSHDDKATYGLMIEQIRTMLPDAF